MNRMHGALPVLTLIVVSAFILPNLAHAQNAIVTENALQGSPPSEWDITGAGDFSIQGYATDISVDQGETVSFKIKTDSDDYRLDIYRLGYYGGDGARFITTVQPSASLPQTQPAGVFDPTTKLLDCGNWDVSASWAVPTDAVSGIYLAKLVREDGPVGASHIVFIVRDDDGNSEILFQTSDTTWQAYNRWGETGAQDGYSLYEGPDGKADKVSYNRPFGTRQYPVEDWLFNAEYPMLRWLERNGYDVSYFTNVDTERNGAAIQDHEVFLSVGHDEYWSRGMRENVTLARDAGVDLGFFSGNEVYWKIRWEDSIDGTGTPYRTQVCYKEGTLGENQCGTKCDPVADVWTGLWRSGCDYTPPADGCEPENELTGQISWMGTTHAITVPADYGHLPFWRNTSVATLTPEQTATLPGGTLGYEWDFQQYEDTYPAGRIRMSETDADGETHHLSLYKALSGALVFGAGTVQWMWGLDAEHDRAGGAEDARMQQATVNLLADMGVQPGTLQGGLVAATPLADGVAPTSSIAIPTGGETIEVGTTTTIVGSATDTGGSGIGLVEISTDGGATWQTADGFDDWTFAWTPLTAGPVTLLSRAMDGSFNVETPGAGTDVTVETRQCPCTIWSDLTVPSNPSENDARAVELGMRFRTSEDGFITAIRFYKGANNVGTHTGHLWTADSTLVATVTFNSETATGWQEEPLPAPVAVTANTTYIVSYHTPTGYYAADVGYFAGAGVDNPPLRALADQEDGRNGVYRYGVAGQFPNQTFNSTNYWVDVRFHTSATDDLPPGIAARIPTPGASNVAVTGNVSVTFNEPVQPPTAILELRDASFSLVPATVTYDVPSRTVTLNPAADLSYSSTYTATLQPATDLAGNTMASSTSWTFTTQDPPPPPPDEGPGGPILVLASATNAFGRFAAEILRAEGLNAFTVSDIATVNAGVLATYDVVVLGEMTLSGAQVTMLGDWVNAGGNLVALRPDPQLAGLLGLTAAGGSQVEGYLLVDTATGPGVGIVGETIQYHGTADLYDLAGATAVATLYSDATTATTHPAVTLVSVGGNGGQAAAFTYDLARSVVYTRQGNPAWESQERDGVSPLRSDDMFYGGAEADWIDLDKVAIPQADEQQRLLANLILQMNADRKPLPRFWYFPRGLEAVVVMTGDEHGTGGNSVARFGIYQASDPPGCVLADWECVRASTYLYPGTGMSDAQAASFTNAGFEVGLHVNTGCNDWTPASLASYYSNQLADFVSFLPSAPAPSSERTHCIAWSDWVTQAKVKLTQGIRLDTNYYYWPPGWVQNRPGMFTGSGMPMRFADLDGTMIDVYQVTTQMTDESDQTYPYTIDTLLDRALGSEGYYGAFCANMHNDSASHTGASAIIASAQARGIPVISGRQLLTWLDARNSSSFDALSWAGNVLSFQVSKAASARNLEAMLPVQLGAATLAGLTFEGGGVSYESRTIKGIEYAVFSAESGSYQADYNVDTSPPVISAVSVSASGDGTATVTWTTDEAADSQVDFGTDPGSLGNQQADATLVTGHSVVLGGLLPTTTYYFRVTSADAGAYSATEPPVGNQPLSFTTPDAPEPACYVETTAADFLAGFAGAGIAISERDDGEVRLASTEGSDFTGAALPAGWAVSPWTGGDAVPGGGVVTVDGALLATDDRYYAPDRVLEFVATFGAQAYQHVGLGRDLDSDLRWALFGTNTSSTNLYARTRTGAPVGVDADLGSSYLGAPHLYRIEWTSTNVRFFIDGSQVHEQTVAVAGPLRPLVSEFTAGGAAVTVDWLRLSPYATGGSFESAELGDGSPTDWGAIAWNGDEPAGTTVSVSVRTGDTPTADGSWTAYAPIVASGNAIGATSGYVQYRLDLDTTDTAVTPTVTDVSIWCAEAVDMVPPIITNLTAIPGAGGTTATITWDTNEAADSRVDYGTIPSLLDLDESDPALTLSHSVELTGLMPGQTYHVRATSADASANATTEPPGIDPPLSFTTPLQPCAVVDTAADFALGALNGLSVAQAGNGELILNPNIVAEFDGTALPAGWGSALWDPAGTAVVAGGTVTVDATRVNETAYQDAGCSLEFVATFGAPAGGANTYQHVGFGYGDDTTTNSGMFNTTPWAMFSTGADGSTLRIRVHDGVAPEYVTDLSNSYLGASHRYRIDWNVDGFVFFIDGTEVHSDLHPIGDQMRAGASDLFPGGSTVSVDWMRLSPYGASGDYESPVYDAGADGSTWGAITWNATEPAGTSLTMSVRGGDTSTPDGTWTAYTPVATSGTDLALEARYLQLEAVLATGDPYVTPFLDDFSITCGCCTGAPNTIYADATASDFISTTVPCATIPVKITRTDPTDVRGYSVTFELSSELELCGDISSSITEGAYLTGFGSGTTFQRIDHLDGTYTVDCAILGTPCGATDPDGTLFTVDVTSTLAEGVGTITVLTTDLRLRDCALAPLPVDTGDPVGITIDTVAPLVVTDFAAQQVLTGNLPGNTIGVSLGWTPSASPDAASVAVYRNRFGAYPEYDDGGGVEPTINPAATPAEAEAAGWTLVGETTGTGAADLHSERDVWYYVAFTRDLHGNPSVPSAMSAGLVNYILGDVSDGIDPGDGNLPGDGDDSVTTADVSLLASYYGELITLDHEANRLDLGPCVGHPVHGRPATDDLIEFEDLILFGINFGINGAMAKQIPLAFATPAPAGFNGLAVEVPPLPAVGETFDVRLVMTGDGTVQALSVALLWDEAVVAPVGVQPGDLLAAQGGTALTLSPRPGTVDVGLLGLRQRGIAGEGVVASLTFRALATGSAEIAVAEVRARSAANATVTLDDSVVREVQADEVPPTVTVLHPNVPNPFNPMTTIAFDLAVAGRVTVKIYSIDGRLVTTLVDEHLQAGRYSRVWAGRDSHGRTVASGAYVMRMVAPNKTETRRMMLLK